MLKKVIARDGPGANSIGAIKVQNEHKRHHLKIDSKNAYFNTVSA